MLEQVVKKTSNPELSYEQQTCVIVSCYERNPIGSTIFQWGS